MGGELLCALAEPVGRRGPHRNVRRRHHVNVVHPFQRLQRRHQRSKLPVLDRQGHDVAGAATIGEKPMDGFGQRQETFQLITRIGQPRRSTGPDPSDGGQSPQHRVLAELDRLPSSS
ncbi:hypothetical protein FGW37_31295 [Streptomyces rectiverticillatus]|uniref:hypothetical protein n=1 Tax=Streptomyces rectiverticillatus TaxID=173860 RepID=UPI0015C3B449|nr:hypothetical protein [Streptomyces rectiverticillatus]QLE75476.1 hypothetical protein FGW37_31295 [Streptomyces rectiverticillatus]